MTTHYDPHQSTVNKLTDSESHGGSVEFEEDEAKLAGAFIENAIDEADIEEDTRASER